MGPVTSVPRTEIATDGRGTNCFALKIVIINMLRVILSACKWFSFIVVLDKNTVLYFINQIKPLLMIKFKK